MNSGYHSTEPLEADVLIIGAGHSGLVAANYIADAGDEVLVVNPTRADLKPLWKVARHSLRWRRRLGDVGDKLRADT